VVIHHPALNTPSLADETVRRVEPTERAPSLVPFDAETLVRQSVALALTAPSRSRLASADADCVSNPDLPGFCMGRHLF
jgi:hypothetical protein